jgi:hypothetical protein
MGELGEKRHNNEFIMLACQIKMSRCRRSNPKVFRFKKIPLHISRLHIICYRFEQILWPGPQKSNQFCSGCSIISVWRWNFVCLCDASAERQLENCDTAFLNFGQGWHTKLLPTIHGPKLIIRSHLNTRAQGKVVVQMECLASASSAITESGTLMLHNNNSKNAFANTQKRSCQNGQQKKLTHMEPMVTW